VRQLVEGLQVMRAALELLLVALVLHGAQLDLAPVLELPGHLRFVELAGALEDLAPARDHALELRVLAPEDDAAPVLRARQPKHQVRLPAAGRAAVQEDVSRAFQGLRLRAREWAPAQAAH
jgi:hypothetical protein